MTQTARIYGGSLYDLAAEEQLTGSMQEQLLAVRQIFRENPDYLRLLAEPSIPAQERKGLIDQAFGEGCEKYLVNFLKLLCDRGLLGEFGGCCDEFTRRYHEDNQITEAVVTSAAPLTQEQQKELQEKLEKLSGKKVTLVLRTDPSVIAGLRVEIGGKQYDGTVQGRLTGIRRSLGDTVL